MMIKRRYEELPRNHCGRSHHPVYSNVRSHIIVYIQSKSSINWVKHESLVKQNTPCQALVPLFSYMLFFSLTIQVIERNNTFKSSKIKENKCIMGRFWLMSSPTHLWGHPCVKYTFEIPALNCWPITHSYAPYRHVSITKPL